MRSKILSLAVSLLILGTSAASAQPGERQFDAPPDWLARPTVEQLLSVWPVEALKAERGGSAVLACTVAVTGGLRDCRVAEEKPAGLGFGAAALALAPQLSFRPAMKGGRAVPAEIKIPIAFQIDDRSLPGQYGGLPAGSIPQVANVTWIEAPTYADLISAYPKAARDAQLGGRASLQCYFEASGRLRQCSVISEQPRGKGFGKAAQQLANRFKGPERLANGKPIAGDATTIAFSFPPSVLQGRYDLTKPNWARIPTAEETDAAIGELKFPTRTRVRLDCEISAEGALTGCRPVDQTPPGQDLSKPALAMSSHMRVSLWTDDGLPTIGAHIVVPIVFQTQEPPKPADSPKPAG